MHDELLSNPLIADSECDFCNELNGGTDHLFQDIIKNTDISRVVLNNGGLRVFPCLGMLADGHLLISPTYHAKSCFQLCPDDAIGLIHLIKEIRDIIKKNTGKTPILFEHGNPTTCEPHCSTCIEHAHLHVLPFDPGMLPVLQLERRLIGSSPLISNPLSHAQVTEPYLMLVDTNLFLHFFSTDDAPRQYLRHLYARLIGHPELGSWIQNISAEQTITNANHYRALFST